MSCFNAVYSLVTRLGRSREVQWDFTHGYVCARDNVGLNLILVATADSKLVSSAFDFLLEPSARHLVPIQYIPYLLRVSD